MDSCQIEQKRSLGKKYASSLNFNFFYVSNHYLASNEMAKPPPRASLIFKTSPFFTVLWMIW